MKVYEELVARGLLAQAPPWRTRIIPPMTCGCGWATAMTKPNRLQKQGGSHHDKPRKNSPHSCGF